MVMAGWSWLFTVGGAALALLGLAIITLALFRDRARGRRRCARCWYDLAGVPGLTCPECGRTARSERALLRTRRRWRRVAIGLLVLLVAWGVAATPRVQKTGIAGIMPTFLLAAVSTAYDTDDNRLFGELACRLGESTKSPLWATRWLIKQRVLKSLSAPEESVTLPKRATQTQWPVSTWVTTSDMDGRPAAVSSTAQMALGFGPALQATHAVNIARQLQLRDGDTAAAASAGVDKVLTTDLQAELTLFLAESQDGRVRTQQLVRLLESHPSPRVRTIAAQCLSRDGTVHELAIPALDKALRSKSVWTRRAAAMSLGRIGPPAASAARTLFQAALIEKDLNVMFELCRTLRAVGGDEASDALCDLSTTAVVAERTWMSAAYELSQSTPMACRCADRLGKQVMQPSDEGSALRVLTVMTKLVRSACPQDQALAHVLAQSPIAACRAEALAALAVGSSDDGKLLSYALAAMTDPSGRVRHVSLALLIKLADAHEPARLAIQQARDDPDDHVRFKAREWSERQLQQP
jgi:hypothetical protein